MAWWFSAWASVATVLNKHPCISSCLRVNQLKTRNAWNHNEALVSIVYADALVLKHQVINIHNTDSMALVPHTFPKKWLLFKWMQLGTKMKLKENDLVI